MKICPSGKGSENLPARLDDPWDRALICHFAKANTRKFEFSQKSSCTTCTLASIAQTNWGRVFWHLIERIYSDQALFNRFCHIENDSFQRLALVPFILYESLSLLLLCNRRFFCHGYFLLAGPFWRCLRFGSFLLITYRRPLRRTI